jgi:hypothetical protein
LDNCIGGFKIVEVWERAFKNLTNSNDEGKVYIVFWGDSFGDWRLEKVFADEEKANNYLKGRGKGYWIMEEEVN